MLIFLRGLSRILVLAGAIMCFFAAAMSLPALADGDDDGNDDKVTLPTSGGEQSNTVTKSSSSDSPSAGSGALQDLSDTGSEKQNSTPGGATNIEGSAQGNVNGQANLKAQVDLGGGTTSPVNVNLDSLVNAISSYYRRESSVTSTKPKKPFSVVGASQIRVAAGIYVLKIQSDAFVGELKPTQSWQFKVVPLSGSKEISGATFIRTPNGRLIASIPSAAINSIATGIVGKITIRLDATLLDSDPNLPSLSEKPGSSAEAGMIPPGNDIYNALALAQNAAGFRHIVIDIPLTIYPEIWCNATLTTSPTTTAGSTTVALGFGKNVPIILPPGVQYGRLTGTGVDGTNLDVIVGSDDPDNNLKLLADIFTSNGPRIVVYRVKP